MVQPTPLRQRAIAPTQRASGHVRPLRLSTSTTGTSSGTQRRSRGESGTLGRVGSVYEVLAAEQFAFGTGVDDTFDLGAEVRRRKAHRATTSSQPDQPA